MPIPKPGPEESEYEFIIRCYTEPLMEEEYPIGTKRLAVCYAQWKEITEKEEAYADYPKSASDEAKKAIKHREENGSNCGTAVGWARARQLANREPLSVRTIKRTYSFLSRASVYDTGSLTDEDGKEVCGSVMYAAWGGDPMLRWCERKLGSIDE